MSPIRYPCLAWAKRSSKTMRVGRRPNWGLALLMRPAKAAPGVPFVNSPLCQRPNVCVSNLCGILARWFHTKPPCLIYNNRYSQIGVGFLSRVHFLVPLGAPPNVCARANNAHAVPRAAQQAPLRLFAVNVRRHRLSGLRPKTEHRGNRCRDAVYSERLAKISVYLTGGNGGALCLACHRDF